MPKICIDLFRSLGLLNSHTLSPARVANKIYTCRQTVFQHAFAPYSIVERVREVESEYHLIISIEHQERTRFDKIKIYTPKLSQ